MNRGTVDNIGWVAFVKKKKTIYVYMYIHCYVYIFLFYVFNFIIIYYMFTLVENPFLCVRDRVQYLTVQSPRACSLALLNSVFKNHGEHLQLTNLV